MKIGPEQWNVIDVGCGGVCQTNKIPRLSDHSGYLEIEKSVGG